MAGHGMKRRYGVLAGSIALVLIAAGVWVMTRNAAPDMTDVSLARASASDMDAAVREWEQARAQALERHLRALAATDEPRNLLLAGLLWPMVDGWRHVDDPVHAQAKAASPVQDWFRRAMASRGDDRLVTWYETNGCSSAWVGCDRDAALAALSRWDEDFDAQLVALAAAVTRGDAAAVSAHLHAAARSSRQWQPTLDLGRAFLETINAIPAPPLSPALASELARRKGFDGKVDATELPLIGALAVWAALPLPSYKSLGDSCTPAGDEPMAGEHLRDCLAVYTVLADGSGLLDRLIATRQGVRLTTSGSDQDASSAWRERLRDVAWLHQQSGRLFVEGATPQGYIATLLGEGEIPALNRLLSTAGLPVEAPDGWLPEDPRLRMLIVEGREPEPVAVQGG